MKNILLESTKSKFKVLEHKPANVLKRIQGVLSDFKSNRNGRIYPRELWENVLNSDYVKEMIESHGLVGELDHPEERLEISLQNVSHVINDMWIEGDQVVGTIDILPTPSGKIVSELLDYGTDIGISSRGAGSVGPDNVVDQDYQFVTFDFVARPSCEAARLNMIVEGVQVEIDNNSDDKVNNILKSYKQGLNEDTSDTKSIIKSTLENEGEILIDRGIRKAVVIQINEENFNDMPTMLIKQLKNEHKLNYWCSFIANANENKPYSYEHLPIFGDSTKFVTKWFTNTREKAINNLLNDKDIAITNRVVLDKSYHERVKNIQKSLNDEDFLGLSCVLDNLSSYDIDPETCKLSELKNIIKQTAQDYIEYERDENFNADKIYNIIIKLFNRNTNEGYKTNLKEDNTTTAFIDIREIIGYAEQYLTALLNSSVGIVKRDDGQYTITMRNDDKTIDKWLKLHNKNSLKEGHSQEDINMMFVDMCKDALSDELGPDWRHKSLADIEDIVHSTVFKYNEANVQPEYENEEFYGDETNANTIYQYILDNEIPEENKTTETRPMNEAVMSDQEVFKTVLEWYKSQIEGGKMTLNQCYELLSDKAKVSLNKMVDQSKIKESIIDATINKLIKESIELNKKN